MGQAKKRGTYEERKAQAMKNRRLVFDESSKLRNPSPRTRKHVDLLSIMAAFMQSPNAMSRRTARAWRVK